MPFTGINRIYHLQRGLMLNVEHRSSHCFASLSANCLILLIFESRFQDWDLKIRKTPRRKFHGESDAQVKSSQFKRPEANNLGTLTADVSILFVIFSDVLS